MKLLLIEVEVTDPFNKMDLDQEIQVINSKDMNFSPEESCKWRLPELPQVPKGVGTSSKPLDRDNKLLSSSEEFHGPTKYSRSYKGLETHVLHRKSAKHKSLVEKQKHFVRGPEERVGPKEVQQPCGRSSSLHKEESSSKSSKQGKKTPKSNQKSKNRGKGKPKWNKPYPHSYRTPNEEKTAMEIVFNMERTLMEFKNKEEERINQFFQNKYTL
ncbi:hypothetical protein O181_029248 [Austropuccinia psidii MF-1]|uniref:Uncharacterized protein n=1 Tax=Austropuccinia psidii MF-1 TaxID=1389203 RepID=A0A9Q3H2K8_9BASI|nr:hypothetical protein [Austropuccinia psidii MF-1]